MQDNDNGNEKDVKKKMKKKTKIIIGIIIFLVIVLAVIVAYEVFFKEDNETQEEVVSVEGQIDLGDLEITIEDEDLYAAGVSEITFIQNGEVYYGYRKTNYSQDDVTYDIEVTKIDGIKNAVSVDVYSLSTDISTTTVVTTEDGTLYEVYYDIDEKFATYSEFLEDYKVAKIVSAEGNWNHEYVLVLKDNRKIKYIQEINDVYDDDNVIIDMETETSVEELGAYSSVTVTGNTGNVQTGNSGYAVGDDCLAFIINGEVYFAKTEGSYTSTGEYYDEGVFISKKIENLSNIETLYCYNINSDSAKTFFAIDENGVVYSFSDSDTEAQVLEYMKDYKVDDIVNVTSAGYDANNVEVFAFGLKLKDGTTTVVYSGEVAETEEETEDNTEVTDEEIAEIQEFLNIMENNGFTQTSFAEGTAKGLELFTVVYNLGGIYDLGTSDYTAKELTDVGFTVNDDGTTEIDTFKITASSLSNFIYKKLGLSLSTIKYGASGLGNLIYSEKYDAYYLQHSDSSYMEIEVVSVEKDGDTYKINGKYKEMSSDITFDMKLEKLSDGEYMFISNTVNGSLY